MPDKTDFRAKIIRGQKGTSNNDKMASTPGRQSHPKRARPRQRFRKPRGAKTDKMRGTKDDTKGTAGNVSAVTLIEGHHRDSAGTQENSNPTGHGISSVSFKNLTQ